jgi:hypothetical protein
VSDGGQFGTDPPAGITLDGGRLAANGAAFTRDGAANGPDLTQIRVINGGQFYLTGARYA